MSRVLPILFNTDMVRAILREFSPKTATRRAIKGYIPNDAMFGYTAFTPKGYISCRGTFADGYGEKFFKLPCQKEDILYVRETWGISNFDYDEKVVYIVYKASENAKDEGCRAVKFPDDKFEKFYDSMSENSPEWRPSIHMPKEAARIWLKVTDVRVERLQDIDGVSVLAEGIDNGKSNTAMEKRWENMQREAFKTLWNSTIKKQDIGIYDWNANPWVWVIEFEQCEKPEGI